MVLDRSRLTIIWIWQRVIRITIPPYRNLIISTNFPSSKRTSWGETVHQRRQWNERFGNYSLCTVFWWDNQSNWWTWETTQGFFRCLRNGDHASGYACHLVFLLFTWYFSLYYFDISYFKTKIKVRSRRHIFLNNSCHCANGWSGWGGERSCHVCADSDGWFWCTFTDHAPDHLDFCGQPEPVQVYLSGHASSIDRLCYCFQVWKVLNLWSWKIFTPFLAMLQCR